MAIYITRAAWTRRLLKAWVTTTIALAATTSVNAADAPTWRPSVDDISKMEPNLRLPEHCYDLTRYARYYDGFVFSGYRIIRGYFIKGMGKTPGVYLNQRHDDVDDGGCSTVTVYYDAGRGRMAGAACSGNA